jgi:hypothetical protein
MSTIFGVYTLTHNIDNAFVFRSYSGKPLVNMHISAANLKYDMYSLVNGTIRSVFNGVSLGYQGNIKDHEFDHIYTIKDTNNNSINFLQIANETVFVFVPKKLFKDQYNILFKNLIIDEIKHLKDLNNESKSLSEHILSEEEHINKIDNTHDIKIEKFGNIIGDDINNYIILFLIFIIICIYRS